MKRVILLVMGLFLEVGGVRGQPIEFPSQEAWKIEFDTTSMALSSVWQSGGGLFCLVHLANRAVLIKDGEVIWQSPVYAALRNASMTNFGNGSEILILSDSSIRRGDVTETWSRTDVFGGENFRFLHCWPCGYSSWNGPDVGLENPRALVGFANPKPDSLRRIGLYYLYYDIHYGPNGGGWSNESGYFKKLSLVNGAISERILIGRLQTILFEDIDGDEFTDMVYSSEVESHWSSPPIDTNQFSLTIGSTSSNLSIDLRNTLVYYSGREEPPYSAIYQFILYHPQDGGAHLWASSYDQINTIKEFSVSDLSIESEVRWPNHEPRGQFLTQFQQSNNEQCRSFILIADERGNIGRFDAERTRFLGDYYQYEFTLRGIKSVDIEDDGQSELLVLTPAFLALLNVENLSVETASALNNPSSLILSSYPNPFNSSTTISYNLPKPGRYALDVVDIQGRLVARLADGWREAGSYREVLNGGQLTSGEYMVRLIGASESFAKPITIVK